MAADRLRWRRSVRFRVTAAATMVVLVVLVLGGVVVVRAQAAALRGNIDDQLEAAAESLVAAAGGDGGGGAAPSVVAGFGDDDGVFQIVGADGEVTAASPDMAGRGPIVEVDVVPTNDDDERVVTVDELPDDDEGPFRVRVEPIEDGAGVVVVAASLEDVEESVGALTRNLLVGVPAATVVLAFVVWSVVGRTLRPVEAIRSEVAAIGGRELHRRVPEPAGDDEIGRLARTMNGMLARIEEASARQQRFVADASHELRSPLTRMRTELEVDLAHPERAALEATHRSVLEETVGLQQLVEDLLHLARSDADGDADGGARVPAGVEDVALDDVVRRAAEDLRAAGRVEVDTASVSRGVVVAGRRQALARLVGNLLDNAGRHAASRVAVSVRDDGDAVELVVADDGPGIPAADAERVFERFTRLDDARAAGAGGTGLGLAIARDIAETHGGTVEVAPSDAGARLVVRLPRAVAAQR